MGENGQTEGAVSPGPGQAGVVILGMHRSGTSAVAGFLAKAGFFAGEEADLLAAAEDNPRGFFERVDVNDLNDNLLARVDGAWDRPPARELIRDHAAEWQAEAEAMLARLGSQAAGRPLVLKDPRISLLLPAWLPAFDQGRFAIVVVDRSPLDVALSMRKRDGRPLYVALAIWQLYCTELLEGLAGRRVLLVRYEDFVKDPGHSGPRLLRQLAEVLPDDVVERTGAASKGVEAEAAGFVSPEMRHHRTEAEDASNEQALTGAQLALAGWFRQQPEGWLDLQAPERLRAQPANALVTTAEYFASVADRSGMEAAYDDERHKALHFEQATELKDHHIERLEAEFRKLRQRVEAGEQQVAALAAETEELRATNRALNEELRHLHEDGRAAASNLASVARRGFGGRHEP
ncbi:MAG TPA: sulfotransferase [Acidimicrobiales bacterium]|nr:sulfotransferase [Acidimicrobiales bacterium]